jgi:hypothetical protein
MHTFWGEDDVKGADGGIEVGFAGKINPRKADVDADDVPPRPPPPIPPPTPPGSSDAAAIATADSREVRGEGEGKDSKDGVGNGE